jgi:hypothetical protein
MSIRYSPEDTEQGETFFVFIHMCIQGLGHFSPSAPTPSLTTHSAPSSPHPQYPAETILPLFLILL